MDEFRLVLLRKSLDIACLTETWLSPDINNDLMTIPGYTLVRSDRQVRRGGGTAFYIRSTIQHEEQNIRECLGSEVEGTFVDFPILQLCMLCVYLPPHLNADALDQVQESINMFMDDFLTRHSSRQVVILGDFNSFQVEGFARI